MERPPIPQGLPTSELAKFINAHSLENRSNTPDFLLAEFLRECEMARSLDEFLDAAESLIIGRDEWYGIKPSPGSIKYPLNTTQVQNEPDCWDDANDHQITERCQCKLCHCLNEVFDGGVCDSCASGGHQG